MLRICTCAFVQSAPTRHSAVQSDVKQSVPILQSGAAQLPDITAQSGIIQPQPVSQPVFTELGWTPSSDGASVTESSAPKPQNPENVRSSSDAIVAIDENKGDAPLRHWVVCGINEIFSRFDVDGDRVLNLLEINTMMVYQRPRSHSPQ